MGNLINRKREKVTGLLLELGEKQSEERFVDLFKSRFPEDWLRINNQWQIEEQETKPGKGHPMQHPDVYMREMYRNGLCRLKDIKNGNKKG